MGGHGDPGRHVINVSRASALWCFCEYFIQNCNLLCKSCMGRMDMRRNHLHGYDGIEDDGLVVSCMVEEYNSDHRFAGEYR